jgi:hypothetical protein
MGISNTQRMGDSSVIECVRLQAGITSFKSWTVGISGAERSNIVGLINIRNCNFY